MGHEKRNEGRKDERTEQRIANRSNSGSSGVHPVRQSHPITPFKTSFGMRISMGMWVGRVWELHYGKTGAAWGRKPD